MQAARGLDDLEPAARVIEIPSNSDPGTVYRVKVDQGILNCECKAFGYRGTCSHVCTAIDQLERAA